MRAWFVTVVLLCVALSPVLTSTSELEEAIPSASSSPLQVTLSSSSGWTSGGEGLTITGTGFQDMADRNVSYDGVNHQWAATNLDMSDQAGRWNAIDIDSNGHIHVVQIKDGNYEIRHSVNDGTGWNSVKINDCGNTYCWDIHMVIDDNDHIHLAYTTYTSWAETLVYMNYDGTTWTDNTVSSSAHFGPIGIAVDSNNHPHISYALNGADQCGNGLRIASYTGTGWSHSNVDSGSNRGCESAIVIDESDNIYIAYQDRSASKLKIATDKSGSWDTYLVDTGTSPSQLYPGYMTSMAMDGEGQFHIAHFDEKEDDLRYSTGTPNTGWATEIVEASGHTGRDPSIAVDAANQPHIVYHTWTGQNLKYATIDPSTSNWNVNTIATNADVGEGNSIVIDENGRMHVAFNDDTADNLKYTTKLTGVVVTDELTVQFGQLGAVTGEVLDDETVQLTTPAVASPSVVTVSIIDKDGVDHTLSATFEFIDQNDLDGDGVPNASDDCPNTAGTSTNDLNGCPDDDGDGYSNTADAFPNDSSEWLDSDGDGVGDNADAFPNDASETLDSDGDGVGDNADAFPNDANETADGDGDGVGDNQDECPDSVQGASVENNGCLDNTDSDGDGIADRLDSCPDENASALDTDNDGCLDDEDEDGVIDSEDACPSTASGENVSQTGCSDVQLSLLDTDGDGVSNAEDLCPETPATTSVDATGCPLAEEEDDETSTSLLSSFFSGESDPVTTTVGVGAILLALFTLLQTNAVAAVLPDAFRWVQVMRKNSKLTKEELNELTYLQSITQAYYGNPRELAEELEQLRGDLTARYTNNDIKKQTREKLFTLIDELLASTPDQLHRIAHNDAYFGLAGTLDAEDRTRLLNEKLAMTNQESATPAPPAHHGQPSLTAELSVMRQWTDESGYTWAEMSDGSHRWWNGTDWQSL